MQKAQQGEGLGAGDVVVIGVDPHKASVTIEARDTREILRATGTFPTTRAGHAAMVKVARQWPRRVWAVEGARGVGRALVDRLVASGERVVDVPAKLSARSRVFDTGQGRKTDAHDAHAIVMVALRDKRLREVVIDEDLEVLRLLVDRRDELAAARTQALNRAHRLFAEVTPGGAPTKKSIVQYQALLAGIRPRDAAGRVRRRMLAEELSEARRLELRVKELAAEIKAAVLARGSHLMDLPGIGPAGAGRILADVGGRGPVPVPASLRVLDRHRTDRRLVRCPPAPPAVPGREPAAEPRAAHSRDRPTAPPRHPRAGVLRPQASGQEEAAGGDAVPQAAVVRRRVPPARQGRSGRRDGDDERGPGRAQRGDSSIQRGRPAPAHRHFGPATSRTRSTHASHARGRGTDPHHGQLTAAATEGSHERERYAAVLLSGMTAPLPGTRSSPHGRPCLSTWGRLPA